MKVLLTALNAKYVHSNLAVRDLEAYACKNSTFTGELSVREYTINQNIDSIIMMLYKERADVIAFSCYIWNINEVLTISKEIKKINPSLMIWLGGPEVSYNSEEILINHHYIDGIIIGEGEATFSELLNMWEETYNRPETRGLHNIHEPIQQTVSEACEAIKGIAYRNYLGVVTVNEAREPLSLDELPFIYEDFSELENKIIYYESSRGCPFSCSYCLSSIDKTVRFRNIELVKKELKCFIDAKVPQVKFIDRTFNCNKERAYEIWEFITNNDNGITNFHFEISADLLRDEDIKLFSHMRKGLIQLEIGLQSTNNNTIKEIRRTMDIAAVKDKMLAVRSLHNIHQHLDLIAGLPFEDYESFKSSFCDAYSMKPHQLQLGFLKVLKGSYMEEMKDEYSIVFHDEPPYEVMSTKWLSYEEIIILKHVEEMVEVYHNSGQFTYSLEYLLQFFDNPFQMFYELGKYYEENNLYNIGYKRESRYEVLRDFASEYIDNSRMFNDLLIYDYYLRENAKKRPDFAGEDPVDKKQYKDFFVRGGTEKFCIASEFHIEQYDSKMASRIFHIETILPETYEFIICTSEANNEATDIMDICRFENGNSMCNTCKEIYCIFDYEHRDSHTKNAYVAYLDAL